MATEPPAELLRRARSVCIVCLGGIGDAVWGLPVANALRDDDPARRISWVVEPIGAPVLAGHPSIDRVFTFQRRRGWRGALELWREMRRERFDLAINLYHLGKSIPPTVFTRAPMRLGLGRMRGQDMVWLAANRHMPDGPRKHSQEQALDFVRWLGLDRHPVRWDIALSEDEKREQRGFFARFGGRPVAAIVPASSSHKKDWLADRYAAVIDTLERDLGYRTLLVGGPGERENRIARDIVERASAKPEWALGDGIRRLLWLLAGSNMVIAPDTGPVHVARAFGVPVVGLYGHTNPWRVGPYRAFEDLWIDRYTDPGDAPDPSDARAKFGRMEQITVSEVLAKVRRADEVYVRPRRAG